MSTLTSSILAASVLAAGLGLAALPQGSEAGDAAAIVTKDQSRLSDRLDGAFELAEAAAVDEAITRRVAAAARKADRLAAAAGCDAEPWPYSAAGCVSGVAHRGPAVRTVTVEYRVGGSTSVLVRLPSPQIAGR